MGEKYTHWHKIKSKTDALETRPEFSERDVWFCHLGDNVGDEQNGAGDEFIRPIVVVRKFNAHICWIVPLTRTRKESQYYVTLSFMIDDISTGILSQMRLVDSKRLKRKIGYISKEDAIVLKTKLKALLP